LSPPRRFGFFGATLHLLIQRRNLNIETFDLCEIYMGQFSETIWQAYGPVQNGVGQAFDVNSSLRRNDANMAASR